MEILIQNYKPDHKEEVINLIAANDFECGDDLPDIGIVALYNNSVIGYIGASKTYGKNAFVPILVLKEEARGLKVGVELMKQMCLLLLSMGIERVEAFTETDNHHALNVFKDIGMDIRPIYLLEARLQDIKDNINEFNRVNRELSTNDTQDRQEDVSKK